MDIQPANTENKRLTNSKLQLNIMERSQHILLSYAVNCKLTLKY